MELQEYLRINGLEKLTETYNIKAVTHQKYPHLVGLKYSMMDSPMSQIVARQSRGIIFDRSNNWEIISYPYDKFFNYGEGHAPEIDLSSVQVYEKLDGSLMTLYYYDSQWQVSSSGTPDGSGEIKGCRFNLAELFWQVWQEFNYQLPTDIDHCYMFELMTAYNKIIVIPEHNRLVLHGVRNIRNLLESAPQTWADQYGWEAATTYPLSNIAEVKTAANLLNPLVTEGYVLCDRHFNRVKIKSPQYVAINHLLGGFKALSLVKIIVANEGEEFLVYFPEWTVLYRQMKQRYQAMLLEIEANWQQYKDIPIQKDFALAVQDLPYKSILFALRQGKIQSIQESLQDEPVHKIIEQFLTQDASIKSQIKALLTA
jgi:hypothetical protein